MAIATPEVLRRNAADREGKGLRVPRSERDLSQTLKLLSAASQRLARTASSRHPPVVAYWSGAS